MDRDERRYSGESNILDVVHSKPGMAMCASSNIASDSQEVGENLTFEKINIVGGWSIGDRGENRMRKWVAGARHFGHVLQTVRGTRDEFGGTECGNGDNRSEAIVEKKRII